MNFRLLGNAFRISAFHGPSFKQGASVALLMPRDMRSIETENLENVARHLVRLGREEVDPKHPRVMQHNVGEAALSGRKWVQYRDR